MYLKNVFFLLLPMTFLLNCSTPQATRSSVAPKSNSRVLPDNVVYLDSDANGTFDQQLDLAESPNPLPSKIDWMKAFYKDIKYPALARENGISGYLTLNVLVNELGQVKDISIAKSLSPDCDAEAIRAYWASTTQGFMPLIVDGKATAFRLHTSAGFWLE